MTFDPTWIQWSILQNTTYYIHTTYILHTYNVHTTYRRSDHIVSFWTQFRQDKTVRCSSDIKYLLMPDVSSGIGKPQPQTYIGDPTTCAIFIQAWGSNWGSAGFSRNQNNFGSSGAYVTCIYCGLRVTINTCKTPHGAQRPWTHFYYVCFSVCGWQKPEDHQFEPHGWRRHYTGRYRGSGISRVYLWPVSQKPLWQATQPRKIKFHSHSFQFAKEWLLKHELFKSEIEEHFWGSTCAMSADILIFTEESCYTGQPQKNETEEMHCGKTWMDIFSG